jgi:hypothetical protein
LVSMEGVMKRFIFPAVLAAVVGAGVTQIVLAQSAPPVAVVKDPGCGCCTKWVAHLEEAGFKATVTESAAIDALKDSKGVPRAARSCHTATVGGYVIEGHVPAADIKRLLKERPSVVGLAVPGMPAGSPGMEVPGGRVAPYDVIAFDKTGKTSVFASHR